MSEYSSICGTKTSEKMKIIMMEKKEDEICIKNNHTHGITKYALKIPWQDGVVSVDT